MKKLLPPITFFCFAFITYSQTPLNYISSTVGGSAYEVCYYDDHVFAGCANTFRVYDLTGPDNSPDSIHYEERFISNIDQLLVNNGHLYICANHAGLFKYDVSNPKNPILVDEFIPTDLAESIYDIAFYGDSLLVAAKNKLLVLDANTLDLLSVYETYSGDSRIRGLDVKDSLLAYTVAYPIFFNLEAGVYLVDLTTMTQLDFYQHTTSSQCEVYFGQSTDLLHVMGGQIGIGVEGLYFALDYSTPTSMSLAYDDTILGTFWVGSIAAPMSAFLINDTVYISTQGGGPFGWVLGDPFWGQVYVYDATNAGSIQYLTDIYAGLYHFDSDFNPDNRKMYIASEWYGILTVDINDIYSEINHGKVITGGWCHGSAQGGDLLAEANEGYGIRLFDISDRSNPLLIAEDTSVGFCRAIAMDENPDYIFGFFLTNKRFRVYEAATLSMVADTTIDAGALLIGNFQNARYHDSGRIAVVEEISLIPLNKRIVVMDVTDPMSPFVEHIRQSNKIEHLLWLSDGNLLACGQDSLIVFDPVSMNILDNYQPTAGMKFLGATESADTLYVFQSGTVDSISKFYYNAATEVLNFVSSCAFNMVSDDRVLMTHDDSILYISSSLDSLKALNIIEPYTELAVYNHGADHIIDNLWGVQDLYYNDGYLFLNEYMGQTTILNTLPFDDSGIDNEETKQIMTVYPNPALNQFEAEIPFDGQLVLTTLDGKSVWKEQVSAGPHTFDISDLSSGLYLLDLQGDSENYSVKLIIE